MSDDDSYDDEYSEDFASQYGGQSQFGLSSINEHDETEQSSSSQQLNKFSSSSQRSSHYSFDDGESKEQEEEDDSYSMDDDFTANTSISKHSIGSISRHHASNTATHLTSSSKLENCNEEENVDVQSQHREEEEEESKDDSYSIDEDFTSVCSTKQSVKLSHQQPSIPETCTDLKEDDDVDIGESSDEKEVEDQLSTNDHVDEYSMDEDFAVTSALSLKNEGSSTSPSNSTYKSTKEKLCAADGTKEDEVSISRSMQQQNVGKGDIENNQPNDMDIDSTTNSVDEEMVTDDKPTSDYTSSSQDVAGKDHDHTSQKYDDDTSMNECLETRDNQGLLASDTPTQNEGKEVDHTEKQPTDIESAAKGNVDTACLERVDPEEMPALDHTPTQEDVANKSMDVDLNNDAANEEPAVPSSPKSRSIDDCDQREESIPKDEVTSNISSMPEPAKYVDELSYILDHDSDEEEEYVEVASNIAVCCNQDDESMEPPVEIKTDKANNKRVDKCNPQMSIDNNNTEEKPLSHRQDKRKPRRSDAQTQTIPKAKKTHLNIQQSKPKPRIKKPSDFVPRCAYAQTKAMKLKKAKELKAAQAEQEKSTKKVLRYSKKRLERLAQPAKHHVYDNKENIQPKSDTCNKTTKKKSVDDESDYGPNFLERMETMEQERRESMARATAEALYQARTDKKKCPKCGNCQTYDEMIHDKTECQNDKCRRGKEKQTYQSPSKFEIKSFEERQRRSQQRRSLVVERIEEERRASLVGGRKSLHQQELLDKVEKARGDFHSRMAKDIAARKDKMMNAEKTARQRLEELHSFKPKLHVAEHLIRNRKGGWENLAAPSRRYTEEYQPPDDDYYTSKKKKRRKKPLESPWGNSSSRSKKKVNDNTLRRRFQQTNM